MCYCVTVLFYYVHNNNNTFYHVVANVHFNQSIYYANESDGKAQAVLVLSNPSSSVVTVEIIANSATAMGKQVNDLISKELDIKIILDDNDYYSGPYNVEFPAGSTITSLSIMIVNDGVTEDVENFTLIINSSSVTIGDPGQTTVTIMDDDSKLLWSLLLTHSPLDCWRCTTNITKSFL